MVEAGDERRDGADVGRVAVGVPARGVDDALRLEEVVPGVAPRHDHERVVGNHVAVAAVFPVAVLLEDAVVGSAPVAVRARPGANVPMDLRDDRIGRERRRADIEHPLHVLLDERRGDHARDDLRGEDRLAVVRDAGRAVGEPFRQVGIAGGHHAEGVDEDLRADLLGDDPPVALHRAGLRRGNALLEPHPRGMLRGERDAAPPEDRAPLEQVVAPRLAEERGIDRARVAGPVGERLHERERAGDVVVRDDERLADVIVDVAVDRAPFWLDALLPPALERAAHVDADRLAEDGGVDLFLVIGKDGMLVHAGDSRVRGDSNGILSDAPKKTKRPPEPRIPR